MRRRLAQALALSVVAHAVLVAGGAALALWRGLPSVGLVDVQIATMSLEEIEDLPLGPPPPAVAVKDKARSPRARLRIKPQAPAVTAAEGSLASQEDPKAPPHDPPAPPSAGTPDGDPPAAARPSDLRGYGPAGSRLTVLLRLDRLRATAYAPAVDALLAKLPDRDDFLDGTGLDLYRDFDALLIATPNPLDKTVTLLAARHRLKDGVLRSALDRGAAATGRKLVWRMEGNRPVAEHRSLATGVPDVRDDRLIVMPVEGLVVVTPPVYRKMLLGGAPASSTATAATAASPDAGTNAGAGGGESSGGGDGGQAAATPPPPRADWSHLLARMDAEDGALPEKAVVMLTGTDIFKSKTAKSQAAIGAETHADPADGPIAAPAVWGMALPRVLTLTIGANPTPYVDIVAELATERHARRWETELPVLQRKARLNPWLVLGGFTPLLDRIQVGREGVTLKIHGTATDVETRKILEMIAGMLGRRPRAKPTTD